MDVIILVYLKIDSMNIQTSYQKQKREEEEKNSLFKI